MAHNREIDHSDDEEVTPRGVLPARLAFGALRNRALRVTPPR